MSMQTSLGTYPQFENSFANGEKSAQIQVNKEKTEKNNYET